MPQSSALFLSAVMISVEGMVWTSTFLIEKSGTRFWISAAE